MVVVISEANPLQECSPIMPAIARGSSASVPASVRANLRKRLGTDSLHIEHLVRDVFLTHHDDGGMVLKRSTYPDQEVLVGRILYVLGAPAFPVEKLDKGWVCMPCSEAPTVGSYIDERAAQLEQTVFFRALGRSLPSAYLLGMRDRNLDNLLYDVGHGTAAHLDYASAFSEPLWRRVYAGHRLLGYLYRRIFLDPLLRLEKQVRVQPIAAHRAFLQGLVDEHQRLCAVPSNSLNGVVPMRRQPYCRYAMAQVKRMPLVWRRSARLVERKYLPGIKTSLRNPLVSGLRQPNHGWGATV